MLNYNYQLLESLPSICGYTLSQIGTAINVPPTTIYTYRKRKDFPLLKLIDLCNSLRIPISYFVNEAPVEINVTKLSDKTYCESVRASLVCTSYQPTSFDNMEFGRAIIGERSMTEAAKMLDINFRTLQRAFFSYEQPIWLSVKRFIEYCDKANINFFDYIADPNTYDPPTLQETAVTAEYQLAASEQRCRNLIRHNKALNNLNSKLKKENETLKALLQANGITYNN